MPAQSDVKLNLDDDLDDDKYLIICELNIVHVAAFCFSVFAFTRFPQTPKCIWPQKFH